MSLQTTYYPFPCNPAAIAREQDDIRAYPFYVCAVSDGYPYGDDADEEDPEEGPCYFATIGDAADYARERCVKHGDVTIRERVTDPEGYPDPADPAVQFIAAPKG